MLPLLELVPVTSGQVLYRLGERITHFYFPLDSAVAKVGVDRRGATAEYVMIGNEGLVGLNTLLGEALATGHAIVQISGRCYRAPTAPVIQMFERSVRLRRAVLRYVSSRVLQIQQVSLCNARHGVEERVCRWMLQALDRIGGGELLVTHAMIGTALGVRREAVTMATMRLQHRQAIRCRRGRIAVLDRGALEVCSCECYAALRRDLEALARDIATR